jgi:hypothetical protein
VGKFPVHWHLVALAAAAIFPPTVSAAATVDAAAANAATVTATDIEVEALRAELAALKAAYSARVAALEARIDRLEAPPSTTQTTGLDVAATPPPAPSPAPRTASAFNPAISLILAGNYADLSQDPESYQIAGFIPAGDEVGPGERSFNLGESELTFSASIDPYFTGSFTAAVTSGNEIEVEEAFFRTLALPAGLSLKGGRFFSGFGYLNEVHAHAWDFIDQPLVYQAFFGGQRAQDGLQLKWLAPLDLFVELGAEVGNGDAFPGTRESGNGVNGVTLFAHLGGDLGDSIAWRGGLSWVDLDAEGREFEDENAAGEAVLYAFTGSSRTWIADATLKWTAQGDPKRRSLKLQGEYLQRTEDGSLAYTAGETALEDDYHSRQSGWYVQGVYQFLPRWRAGVRYDALDSGTPRIGLVQSGALGWDDFALLAPATPARSSLMVDWSLSEFSRLRAQYAWDDARRGTTDEQFFLQYIHALGAHGAHKF